MISILFSIIVSIIYEHEMELKYIVCRRGSNIIVNYRRKNKYSKLEIIFYFHRIEINNWSVSRCFVVEGNIIRLVRDTLYIYGPAMNTLLM